MRAAISALTAANNFVQSISAPAAPGGIVTTGGAGQIVVTWNAAARATQYDIYKSTVNGDSGTYYVTTDASTLTYTDTVVTGGTRYYYTVVAVNSAGYAASAQASAVPSSDGTGTPPGGPDPWTVPAGWQVVATELFTDANTLANNWQVYDATVPHDQSFDYYKASQVQVVNVSGVNELQLSCIRTGSTVQYGGAVWTLPASIRSTNTRIEFRIKVDGGGFQWVAMYWPVTDSTWPTHGELDMLEQDAGGNRIYNPQMNVHYSTTLGDGGTFSRYNGPAPVDFASSFHDIAFEWGTDAGSEYTAAWCDGVKYGDSRDQTGLAWQPPVTIPNAKCAPMKVIFQQDAGFDPNINNYEVTAKKVHVQRVRVLAPA